MLTVSQEIVVSQLAQELIEKVASAIRSKPIQRTSVRYEKGERITTNFAEPANTTGNLIRSLQFRITETHLIIEGADYVYYLIHGRKPTKSGGSGSVKEEIQKWVRAKGIVSQDISEQQLVYLITRKIHREGSSIYIRWKGQENSLFSNIVTTELLEEFNRKFTAQLVEELRAEFGN